MLTRRDFEGTLRRHLIDVWFPRCLDLEHGGFLSGFDREWHVYGPQEKLLEFQARQTWVAAELLRYFPSEAKLHQAAQHGFRFLREIMWDRQAGGWFHRVDRAGNALESSTKHAHGIAYAIAACASVHAATGEPGSSELASEGLDWLERYAHDECHGGYFGWLKQDGTPIRQPRDCPWPTQSDTIDTPIGFKDINVHSDLFETFLYLCRLQSEPRVWARLNELANLICHRIITPSGALFYFFEADWTPAPQLMRYGQALQTTFRLLAARDVLGRDETIVSIARRVLDLTLRYAWDEENGGFFLAGPGASWTTLQGHDLLVRRKEWWIQFEGLRALLALNLAINDNSIYLDYFERQWKFLHRYIFDAIHGGVYLAALDGLPRWRQAVGARWAPGSLTEKGNYWKDASHEGWALLYCASMLDANGRPSNASRQQYGVLEARLPLRLAS